MPIARIKHHRNAAWGGAAGGAGGMGGVGLGIEIAIAIVNRRGALPE